MTNASESSQENKCSKCDVLAGVVKEIKNESDSTDLYIWEDVKHDFQSGYNSACERLLKRMKRKLSGDHS